MHFILFIKDAHIVWQYNICLADVSLLLYHYIVIVNFNLQVITAGSSCCLIETVLRCGTMRIDGILSSLIIEKNIIRSVVILKENRSFNDRLLNFADASNLREKILNACEHCVCDARALN